MDFTENCTIVKYMSEISINKEKLADKIVELEKLRDQCNNHSTWKKVEKVYGSGEVIDIINSLDKEQVLLMEAFDN